MFATSGDILNIALAVGFIVLVIFVSILCFYAIMILRDVSKVVDDVEEVTTRVRKIVVEPLRAFDFAISKMKPYIELAIEKRVKEAKKKRKK